MVSYLTFMATGCLLWTPMQTAMIQHTQDNTGAQLGIVCITIGHHMLQHDAACEARVLQHPECSHCTCKAAPIERWDTPAPPASRSTPHSARQLVLQSGKIRGCTGSFESSTALQTPTPLPSHEFSLPCDVCHPFQSPMVLFLSANVPQPGPMPPSKRLDGVASAVPNDHTSRGATGTHCSCRVYAICMPFVYLLCALGRPFACLSYAVLVPLMPAACHTCARTGFGRGDRWLVADTPSKFITPAPCSNTPTRCRGFAEAVRTCLRAAGLWALECCLANATSRAVAPAATGEATLVPERLLHPPLRTHIGERIRFQSRCKG